MIPPRHVPVLLDRVVALLAPALRAARAPSWSTPPSASAATPRRCSTRCPQARVDRHRPRPRRRSPLAGERLAPFGDRFTAVHAVYDELRRRARRPRPAPRVDARALRPRGLLDAARRARARLRLRRGRPARHADGRHRRPDRGRRPQHLPGRRPDPDPAGVRRGAVRPPDRRSRSSASARTEPFTTSARLVELLYADDPGAGPAYRRPPGQAHLPGAADGGQRRARGAAPGDARPPSTRSASAAASSSSPTTRWRTGWSSRPSPRPPAATCPTDLPFVPEGHEPALRLVTRGAEKADRGRDRRRTRAPPRSGCAPSNGSRLHPRSTRRQGAA